MLSKILPQTCQSCKLISDIDFPICQICLNSIIEKTDVCYKCGSELLEQSIYCQVCLELPTGWFFDRLLSAFLYDGVILKMLNNLKFQKDIVVSKVLADLLIPRIINWYNGQKFPELIIPVPLSGIRILQRGYNQVTEIAKHISKSTSIPLATSCVQRIKHTKAQATLTKQQRVVNVANSFNLTHQGYKVISKLSHLVVMDDVVTTGSTVNALCKLLANNFPELVIDVWSVATP